MKNLISVIAFLFSVSALAQESSAKLVVRCTEPNGNTVNELVDYVRFQNGKLEGINRKTADGRSVVLTSSKGKCVVVPQVTYQHQ
jgi:hypothetical protein